MLDDYRHIMQSGHCDRQTAGSSRNCANVMRERRKSPGVTTAGAQIDRKKPTRFGGLDLVSLERAREKGKSLTISWSEWQDLNLRPLRPERK